MDKNLIIPEKIKLLHIDLIETFINDIDVNDVVNFDFKIAHNTRHNLNDERVKIELYINLLSENETRIRFHIDFHYSIDDLKDHYELNENDIPIFDGQFISTLIGISFSTARGIIFQQLKETKLNGIILPVVSPVKILGMKKQ